MSWLSDAAGSGGTTQVVLNDEMGWSPAYVPAALVIQPLPSAGSSSGLTLASGRSIVVPCESTFRRTPCSLVTASPGWMT